MSKSSEYAIEIVNERQEREALMLQTVEAMEEKFRKDEGEKEGWQNIKIWYGMFKLSEHGLKLSQIFTNENRIDKSEILHMMNWLFMIYISDDDINKEDNNV